MPAYSINDRTGRLHLTVIAVNRADANRAIEIGLVPEFGPFEISPCPASVARSALRDWRSGWTTDKAVDLTTNEGWDEL